VNSSSILALICASIVPTSAQILVNEVSASNTRGYPDMTDFEDYPDWIELHNPGAAAISLNGYFLSDNPGKPFKWRIPNGATIDPDGYLIILADGHDAGPGESHPRGYWPWRNFTTEKYHSNFSLSADGESVVLTRATGISTSTLVAEGSVWKYLDDGSDASTQWRARVFDDSNWASGAGVLGYGDDEDTEVSFGDDSDSKHITTYFRHTVNIPDPTLYHGLTMSLKFDDGAVVYLNGAEVGRSNLGNGELDFKTRALDAIGGDDEDSFTEYRVPISALVTGDNVFAVEVHQASPSSSDLTFDFKLEASSHTGSIAIDSITFGKQVSDVSYGRDVTNPATWKLFAEPTPGAANSAPVVTDLRRSSQSVDISPAGGFFTNEQMISLRASEGDIRYTLDGSNPTTRSTLYTVPILISSTTIVRARCFEAGSVPGNIFTASYFYGESPGTLPIVSVVADPETLFGDVIGIYENKHEPITSDMNEVYKGKDAPGHIEYFPADGSEGFQVNGGIRIGGENNWGSHEQKALNFSLRGKYGDDVIKYDLFPGSGIPVHGSITLREGGDDWDDAMLRDPMHRAIAESRLQVETSDFRPSIVFINGTYWGIYNIRARWDEQWFFEHYGVDNGEYDHLGYGHFTSGNTTLGANHGDTADWRELLTFIDDNDITDPAVWAFVEAQVDIDSFIDFVVTESFENNSSWSHNREFWRAHAPGSKWRWFLPDMDRTYSLSDVEDNRFDDILKDDQFLDRIKANPAFEARLAQRFAAHCSSTFAPARISAIVDELGLQITNELPRHKALWDGSTSQSNHLDELQEIKDYTVARQANVFSEIESELGLDPAVNLTLALNGSGSFEVAGVPMEAGTHPFYPGLETEIVAVPAPGFAFDSWALLTGGAATTFNLISATTFTATFIPVAQTVVSGTLAGNTNFNAAGSPYLIVNDLIVPTGATLTLEPGTSFIMSKGRHLRVQGTLLVDGTPSNKVTISGHHGDSWGGISFEEPSTTSLLTHLTIRNATRGIEPTLYPAAIAGLNATLELNFIDIAESRGPLFFRGGSMILRDSLLHIPIIGDGVNVKGGDAETYRTTFLGNNSPDVDAIDYDGVVNGIIKDCRIYNFRGFNSDGIDTGEQCVNILIEGNHIYYTSDKGVSVGQGSTVTMRNNIIVGCPLGVGIKDFGSTLLSDQNTFFNCTEGITVFEKNFGKGGGDVIITNTVISGSDIPVNSDTFSTLTTSYSLSDTSPLIGTSNLNLDPLFVDESVLNFQLQPNSPALDTGDPAHDLDNNGTQADRGAVYTYAASDYPFTIDKTVVVNEVLANSGLDSDWIELHNRTANPIDIGGWFLSDSSTDLAKYRIPAGTIIHGNGFLIFYEDTNFGPGSTDSNRVTSFALSDDGETVYLTSAISDQLTDYRFKEDFGASLKGETFGYHQKQSTGAYNFVTLNKPTQAAANAGPKIGPIVISEIMYNPAGSGAAEYFELLNISDSDVTLFDAARNKAWKLTGGIEYEFPALSPLVMAPGQRIVLTRSITDFNANFTVPSGTLVIEWITGKLSNGGETLQLDRPGPVNALNETQFVRVDRVKYDNNLPWVSSPDGGGSSLSKIAEKEYGNDYINWMAATGSPGDVSPGIFYNDWALANSITDPLLDDDQDGISNLTEYAMGSDPRSATPLTPLTLNYSGSSILTSYPVSLTRPDVDLVLESSPDLQTWRSVDTTPLVLTSDRQIRSTKQPSLTPRLFWRLKISLKP
jgi:hypothetical protein